MQKLCGVGRHVLQRIVDELIARSCVTLQVCERVTEADTCRRPECTCKCARQWQPVTASNFPQLSRIFIHSAMLGLSSDATITVVKRVVKNRAAVKRLLAMLE